MTSAAANARLLPARVGGALLATASGVTAALRRNKPLHPVGGVTHATWQVTQPAGLDVPLLDSPLQRVVVRLSRAASLTRVGWDVMGLAIRAPHAAADGHDADLLFATTGTGLWTRFLVVPQPAWGIGDYTTLFPLAWRGGTVVLRLHARSVTDYDVLLSTRGDDRTAPARGERSDGSSWTTSPSPTNRSASAPSRRRRSGWPHPPGSGHSGSPPTSPRAASPDPDHNVSPRGAQAF